jgi:hypothetical protein
MAVVEIAASPIGRLAGAQPGRTTPQVLPWLARTSSRRLPDITAGLSSDRA